MFRSREVVNGGSSVLCMNVENATREGRHDLEARSLQHARPSNAAAQVFWNTSPHLSSETLCWLAALAARCWITLLLWVPKQTCTACVALVLCVSLTEYCKCDLVVKI